MSEQDMLGVHDKHPFVSDGDNQCTTCGQPESNASHPPLAEETLRPTLDAQMAAALSEMRQLHGAVMQVDRTGWTREQWVAEADEIMDDIHGSVATLLNGHINALFEELHELRRRNLSMRAFRSVDLRTILRVSPVVDAAQQWLAAQEAIWAEADNGKGVAGIPESPNWKPSLKSITDLADAVSAYNAIVEAEEAKERGEKNG